MTKTLLLSAAAAMAFAAAPAVAKQAQNMPSQFNGPNVASGSANGFAWQARSLIIGGTPTSDVLPPTNTIGGGDPIYFPTSDKSGVVALIIERPEGLFICSGSLMSDRVSILTAAHCVSGGFGTPDPISTTAYFFTGDPNERTPFSPNATAVDVTKFIINEGYTGEVIDQNDIAILRLANGVFGVDAYDIYGGVGLTGEQFNVAGYGGRSTVGGAQGTTFPFGARTGYLREGDNIFDYALGNSVFGGFFTDRDASGEGFFGFADYELSYVSDFDNGLAAQSQAYRICVALASAAACAPFDDNGLGAREVGVAGGDSGGPQFIDGKLAAVTSYGLTFGTTFGDFGGGLNSGWGEYSGYVPLYIHGDFIDAALAVPEPATWGMMIAGFGLVGFAARRRRGADMTRVAA